jgi:flagellar biosynthesis protein FlhG
MKRPIIVSVGGGKGGVGKSTVASYLGAALSQKGFCIGFIDADLGGANLHSFVGVKRPSVGLQDFLSGRAKTIEEIVVRTSIPNTWLVSGASDILELANPKFSQKQRLIANLKIMNADFIFVDLASGANHHVTDFYASFPYGIIVSDCLSISIENAYGFLKNGILRGLLRLFPDNKNIVQFIKRLSDSKAANGFSTVHEMLAAAAPLFPDECVRMKEWLSEKKNFLVLNMVKDDEDIRIGMRFIEMAKKYLSVPFSYIGYISYDPAFRASVRESQPASLSASKIIAGCFNAIASNLIALTRR